MNFLRNSIKSAKKALKTHSPTWYARLSRMMQAARRWRFHAREVRHTYGIALLEATSCCCAVIVSDVAGAGEIVNGTNGIKIPLTDPDTYAQAFAKVVERLARHPEERMAMGEAARRHILEHHDWSDIAIRLNAIYEEIACE